MTAKAQFVDEQSESGEFERQEDAFRNWVTDDGSSPHPVASGRYHLYVSLACPWVSRTLIVRTVKGLEDAVGMTVVDPIRDERGWAFREGPGHSRDPVNNFKCNLRRIVDYSNLDGYLRDLYQQPGISETVNFDHIKRHYYMMHDEINPTRIVPIGPVLDLHRPHGREKVVGSRDSP